MLAFDTARLLTITTSELLMMLTRNVIINGFKFTQTLKFLLQDMSELGRHTSIIHFTSEGMTQYMWTHRDIQPWGEHLPVQCFKCSIIQKWVSISQEPGSYAYECSNDHCRWVGNRKVGKQLKFVKMCPEGVAFLHKNRAHMSLWMKVSVD